jgi:hypothetical protein
MKAHAGLMIAGKPLDPYGNLLTNATMVGDGWRRKHDINKWNIADWLKYADVQHITEVYGLFASCVNQEEINDMPHRKRQGLVPDFMINFGHIRSPELNELKIVNHCRTYFNDHTVDVRCGGVSLRAGKVHNEYEAKSKKVDVKYNGFDPSSGGKGPMQRRLAEFGQVRALVIGPRGEGSKDLHRLVTITSEIAAERRWRGMGARNQQEARAIIKCRMIRSIGITAVREATRMKRERLGIVLGNETAASRTRQRAGQFARTMREEYCASFGRGPGGRGSERRH